MSEGNFFGINSGFLFAPDESVELVFEHPPTAADFLSLDFTVGYVFEISWAGNLQIQAGLLGVEKYAVFAVVIIAIVSSIKTVSAAVRCFSALIAPATLQFTLVSHECDLDGLSDKKFFYVIGLYMKIFINLEAIIFFARLHAHLILSPTLYS